MPKRQAQPGEVSEGVEAVYIHGDEAAAEVADDVREGIREMVAVNVRPSTAYRIVYGANDFPTMRNVDILRDEPQFCALGEKKVTALLKDSSPRTAVEDGDGHFPAVHAKRKWTRLSSSKDLAAIFKECIMPTQLQQSTREAYFTSWRTVLTWGVAHEEVQSLLPMNMDTLQAITQELLMIGCAAGTVRNLWSAIEDRHRTYGYDPPLAMRMGDFSRYSKAIASIKGTPSRLLFPVGVHHVYKMIQLEDQSLAEMRNTMLTVLGTVMCMRVNEIDQLQICDVLWRFDAAFHIMYAQTLACRIYKRKQDTARKGLYPRAGGAVFTCLLAYTERAGLDVEEGCSKGRSPGARCRSCMPLFPRIANGVATTDPMSRQQVTNAVLETLASIGVDNTNYSGISMRRGGISAGLAARVPEPILFLQSGHGSNCAARNYMVPRDPHVLYETYLAFGLQL